MYSTGSTVDIDNSTHHGLLSSDIEEMVLELYDFGKLIGRGASGEVHVVREKSTGTLYACKSVRLNNRMNDHRTMATEICILKRAHHENIVCMHEIFEARDATWFILDLVKGDLIEGLTLLPSYSEASIAELFKQLLQGVQYLHSIGVVHRDLKIDNLLYSLESSGAGVREGESGGEVKLKVKIADFGLSAQISADAFGSKSSRSLKEMWGTTEYFAPEVYKRAYGPQADVWALGCILYEMLTGEIAFPSRELCGNKTIERFLLNGGVKIPRDFERREGWKALSPEAQSLIKGMLKTNPVQRFSIQECLQHPWIHNQNHRELSVGRKVINERFERRVRRSIALAKEEERVAMKTAHWKNEQNTSNILSSGLRNTTTSAST